MAQAKCSPALYVPGPRKPGPIWPRPIKAQDLYDLPRPYMAQDLNGLGHIWPGPRLDKEKE